MPIKCPNLRDERARAEFNGILIRLGGQTMAAADVSPRQGYLGRLNEGETRAYNVAHYLWNAHKTPAEIGKFLDALDEVRAAMEKPPEVLGTSQVRPTEKTEKPIGNGDVDLKVNTPAVRLAERLVDRIGRGKLTAKDLQAEATAIYGGTLAEGKFDRKDIQDALELAVNLHIRDTRHLRVDSPDPRQAIKMLGEVLSDLPTQRVRSEEQESFQQFSTPPTYAAAAAYAANLKPRETVLEPSAGTGSLVAAAWGEGRRFIANELSERRSDLLKALVGEHGDVFHENAEQLNNVLPDNVKPTVVVMNPPFSQTAGRLGDRKDPMVAARHVEQALKRLAPGGRLVAIVGRGMAVGQPVYRPWWKKIGEQYTVRANIGVDGKVYEKYGTTFGTRLLVIDKVQPQAGDKPVLTDVQTADELMRVLEPIRDARAQVSVAEQHAAGEGGAVVAQAGSEDLRPRAPSPVPAATGGARVEGGGDRGVAAAGAPLAAKPGGAPVRVEAGERDGVAPVQSERPGEVGAAASAPAKPAGGEGPAAGGSDRAVGDLQPAAGGQSGLTAGGERIELEHAEPGTQGASEISDSLYDNYEPQRVKVPGAKPHPSPLVESAAMASVPPPKPTYQPRLPKRVIEKGLLSNAQIEPVIYAGEAHSKMLPAAEGLKPKRKGFFIGDGTGVGKGREVAGIILDNWQQGRRKAVWVSEKKTLLHDAKRDWSGLEQNPNVMFDVGKVKTGEPIQAKEGIGFITYDTLKGGMSDQRALARGNFVRKQDVSVNGQSGTVQRIEKIKGGKPDQITVKLDNGQTVTLPANEVTSQGKPSIKSRVDQLVDWFGPDFDGVIAFDEAHNMGNATDIKGERGVKDAAQKAIAGMMLQDRLPNARIVYVSATGATEVSNLSYADRLGLWGRGTPFASREKFVSEVEKGGIAAMELIARDMKQLGLYTARNLSYDGVEYERLEHKLDKNQREIYDTLAEAWQVVLRNINEALEATGGNKDSRAKSAALSAFWGGHQRFFNQIVTSLQMPSVIKAVEKDIAAGRQAVLQLTNTNEASQERAAAKAQSAEEIEDLDITPRDQIIQLVENSFPTQEYEKYVDENGKERARPVVDSQGNAVQNKEALAMREALIEKLASVRVPQGPLDMVLDHFGSDVVAEVTGRGRRFVRKRDEKTGEMRRVEESRPGSSNIAETDAFQAGQKKVLVFSEAGGTGRSYHADKTAPSKKARRVHYLVQGGWRADKAVQGFGRTHRSNQQSAPIFKLVTTDLQGQKRFISSIARRLAQLGALTKGQRQAGDQGIFTARDNLESAEANAALRQFFADLVRDAVPGIHINDFEEQTGLKLRQKDDEGRVSGALQDTPPITQFLNRLLSLKIDLQNKVFDAFSDRLDAVIEARRQAGLLDVGLETVKADKIEKKSEQVVHKVEGTDAVTKYVKFSLANKFVPTDFKTVANNEWRPVKAWVESPNGKVYAVAEAPALTDGSGKIIDNYRIVSPVSDSRIIARDNIDRRDGKWRKIDRAQAQDLWQREIANAPEYVTRDMHVITGAILPIWDRLNGNPRVVRLQTDKGERFIGRVVPNDAIASTLKALGAEAQAQKVAPTDLMKQLMQGSRATLANGWSLRRVLVAGEHRIELKGPSSFSEGQEAKRDGVFTEKIDYKLRYFVPTEAAAGSETLRKLLEYRPVMDLTEPGRAPDDMAAGDEPMFSLKAGSYEMRQELTDKFSETADKVYPLLRAELDRLGLGDIALKIADNIEFWLNGKKKADANGLYVRRAITLALEATDAKGLASTLHHEALHALRELGLFTDGEWRLLSQESNRRWRKDFDIGENYGAWSEEKQTEEGIAHAYAAWIGEQIKPDGRFVRLFKRIKNFLEALRNVFRGLGFKSAEDVFRDIKSGEIGSRNRARGAKEEPSFSLRAAEREPTPNLDQMVRDRIAAALEGVKPLRDRFVEGTQDLSHPVKLLQDELERRREAAFEDPQSFYVRKRLYPGRLGAWVDTFNKKHLDPIVKLMKANDLDLQDAGDFLYALHAPERNAEMAKINPGLEAGSGMTNEEAEKILDAAKASGNAAAYDELRQRVAGIRKLVLDIMEQAGLEKPAVIDAWRKQYDDYVPLKGWEVTPDDAPPEFKGVGQGFQVRGQEIKRAFGRRSKADNPLINVLDQAYRTFDRAERNRYLQSVYRAIDEMKDDAEDIATLDKGKAKKEIDPRTGLVRVVEGSANYFNPKAVYLKFDGNPHFIVFKDQKLAEAVKRMSPEGIGAFQKFLIMQNKIKALWTHYSPDFMLRHFLFRYPIEGTLNSFEQKETGNHSVSQYVKDGFPLLGNASKAIFASAKGETHDDARVGRLQKYWDEMRRAGGGMVFRNMRDTDLLREHLETALKDLSNSPLQNARAKWRHTIEALDKITNALDNALRLAAYASARDQGKTPQQAALIAREATVDFQLKGKWSNAIGMWFPFGNVAIQTGMRMTKAVYRSKIMQRVFAGTMLAGFLTAAFNYLVAGNDKDGVPFFEKIPEWDRRMNFIILNPFDKDDKGRPQPIKIPMPYNWALPLALGYAFGTQVFGKESVRKTLASVEKSFIEVLTPFGQEENKAAALVPELGRPFVHVYTNEDWAGRPIHNDPRFQKRPNAESGRRSTGQGWQKIAEGVNEATGGSRSKSGMIDLYPEDYRELIGHFIGTQISLGQNLFDTGSALAKGDAPPATKTPLARVVHGTDYDSADRARAFELRDKQRHPYKR